MARLSEHHVSSLEPVVRPLVPPDERYGVAAEVRTDLGAVAAPSIGLNPLSWLEAIQLTTERGLFGRALVGSDESVAGSLHRLVREPGQDPSVLLVTDRYLRLVRLPLARTGAAQTHDPDGAAVVAAHPRAAVTGAAMAPYGVQRSRFVLTFQDGSSCTLACLFSSVSRVLVAALAPGGQRRR